MDNTRWIRAELLIDEAIRIGEIAAKFKDPNVSARARVDMAFLKEKAIKLIQQEHDSDIKALAKRSKISAIKEYSNRYGTTLAESVAKVNKMLLNDEGE